MTRLAPAVAAAVLLAGLTAPALAADRTAPAADTPGRPVTERPHRPTGRLQVRFEAAASPAARQAAFDRLAARGLPVRVDARIPHLNAAVLSVSSTAAVAALLREDAAVDYVEPESRYAPLQASAEPAPNEHVETGADTVRASGNTGSGYEVALLDARVSSTNPDLNAFAGKVTFAGEYATDQPARVDDPYRPVDSACTLATCPHGTAVATVLAADAGDGGMVGVAPGARIRSYGVMRRFVYTDPKTGAKTTEPGASSADVARALGAVATYAETHPSLVAVLMPFGNRFDNRLLRDAIADLHARAPRVVVVAASGNDGTERAEFPAGDPYVLSVGATWQTASNDWTRYPPVTVQCPAEQPSTDTPWQLAPFSNTGDVDVVAPGACVRAWSPQQRADGTYVSGTMSVRYVNGTSYAAAIAAGAVTLVAPAATGDAARAALVAAAAHREQPRASWGSGGLRIPAAIDLADGPQTYTAAFFDRGGRLAEEVGRRDAEVLRVAPGSPAPPDPAHLSVPPQPAEDWRCTPDGCGTVGPETYSTRGNVTTTRATYHAPPAPERGTTIDDTYEGYSYALNAAPPEGTGEDVFALPVTLLHAVDNVEGLPARSGFSHDATLRYGLKTGMVFGAWVPNGARMDYLATMPHYWTDRGPTDVYLWEPATSRGEADAAMEPVWRGGEPAHPSPYNTSVRNSVTAGTRTDPCEYLGGPVDDYRSYRACRSGRYLVGWLLGSVRQNSGSRLPDYHLDLTFGPKVSVNAPLAASSTSTRPGPIPVRWNATNAPTGRYDVEWAVAEREGDGAQDRWAVRTWQPWLTGTTARSASFGANGVPTTVRAGETYYVRVTARDAYGNVTRDYDYSSVPLDDSAAGMAYSPSWDAVPASDRWYGRAHRGTVKGATFTFTYDADRFAIVGDMCPTCGQFQVYVNGVSRGTVDTYAPSLRTRQVLYLPPAIVNKPATLKVVVVGTANRPKVVLDGIGVIR